MRALTDNQLLEAWVTSHSDPAFAELVRRYVDLVYSAALRQVGDSPLAEDVVQAVFLLLARKAASLLDMATLAGWLYRTTRFAANRVIRTEARRRRHEQEAASMNPTAHLSDSEDATWAQVAPLLDEAMAALAEADRNAVLLRFFEAKPMGVVGKHLGVSEDAAKKRVSRAVDKLRGFLVQRGVTLSVAALAGAMTCSAVQAAPAGLAVTVTAAAGKGATVGASIAALVNGTMRAMTWVKLQFAVGVGAAVLLAWAGATIALTDQRRRVEFEAMGFISRVTPGGESSLWGEFSAAVSGEKSIISFRYFNGESFVCGTDGRDSYLLNEMLPTRLKNPSNPQFGTISEGPFPTRALSPQQLIWLAYASSSFLAQGDLRLPMESFQEVGSYVTNKATLSKEPPHVPSHIQWWSPNFLIVGKTNRSYLIGYPEGYFAAEFTAVSHTNFMGMSLPLRCAFSMLAPRSYDSASSADIAQYMRQKSGTTYRREDVLPVETLVCTLTNLTTMSYKGDFLPAHGTNVSMEDWRFERQLGHGIHITDKVFLKKAGLLVDVTPKQRWPMRDDPQLLRLVRASLESKEGIVPGRLRVDGQTGSAEFRK